MVRRPLVCAATAALTLALTAAAAVAAPVITRAAGANAAAIQSAVDGFRGDLGALNTAPGSAPAGRREINWDGVADGPAANLPFDFFNATVPRGVLLTNTSGAEASTQVSLSDASTNQRFRNINGNYPALFRTFSAERLFTSSSRPLDVVFRVPGSLAAATTNGFGVVFTSVSLSNSTFVQFFDVDGRDLGSYFAPTGTLSFLGVRFDGGERVGLVRIQAGNQALAAGENDLPGRDVVATDDFVYGEPQPAPPSGESFESGLGGFRAESLAGPDPTWNTVQTDAHGGSGAAFVPSPGRVTDMTLTSTPVAIRTGGPSALTFFQRVSTENTFDGGLVEISADDGATWQRPAPSQYSENPPTVRITNGFRNPLAADTGEALAFSGSSNGWQRTILDLTPFAGRTIRYRFRLGSDSSVGARGWWIDDVSVTTPPVPPLTPGGGGGGGGGGRPGGGGGGSTPPPAATLTALSVSPSAFAVNRRGRIRFTLSAAGTVRFTLARVVRGRRVRGSCRVPAPRRGRPCTKTVTLGSFTAAGGAGANSLAFPARVGGRGVIPGTYRLTARLGTGSRSATVTVRRAARRSGRR